MRLNATIRPLVALLSLTINIVANRAFEYPQLLDATLEDLRQGLESGLFTSVDLTNAYIARIEETNDALRAVIKINPDALAIAAELDKERLSRSRGPLHGIPVLVKDNIATDDRMDTTAGSYALVGAKVPRDSTVVAKLRNAGAVILGKTNLSQWASLRGSNSSDGWSAIRGQTVGAYFPGQSPSGSSSGSAVAASVGLAWAAVGTETSGSICAPAHMNNVVGIKPTLGLTSRYLVVPNSSKKDTVGPHARTVNDAAMLLTAMVGRDQYDNYTSAIPWEETPDYVAACTADGLKGKRLGVPRGLFDWLSTDASAVPARMAFDEALEVLRSAGAEIVDNVSLPGLKKMSRLDYVQLGFITGGAEFANDLETKYLDLLKYNPNNITDLESLRDWTQRDPREGWPEHDTVDWDGILEVDYSYDDPEYWRAGAMMQEIAGPLGYTGAFEKYNLDALVMPTLWSFSLASQLGSPVISVPMGATGPDHPSELNRLGNLNVTGPNQPFGLGFAGNLWDEENLIAIACAYEARTHVRSKVTPLIRPKTELHDIVAARTEMVQQL